MARSEQRDWKAIAEELHRQRGQRTQGEFGRAVGLSQGQVSDLERGAMRRLSAPVLESLRAILPPALLGDVAHGMHASSLNAQPPLDPGPSPELPPALGRRLTDREKAVIYPLVAAVLDLWRLDDENFEQLLKQIGIFLKAAGRDRHPSIDLALKIFRAAPPRAGSSQPDKKRRRR